MSSVSLVADAMLTWTEVASVAQGVAALMGMAALCYSIVTFRRSLNTTHYNELDRMYFDLLHMALEKPYLRNPLALQNAHQKQEYDVYAYMVWNFLEAVHDRCMKNKELCSTWHPTIDAEDRLHRKWFEDPANRDKFKSSFREFVAHESYRQKAAAHITGR